MIGSEHARTLMNHLPQHPSDEAVTKADLNRFGDQVDSRFERIDERFERIDEGFTRMEQRFERLEQRFEQRFDRMEERFDRRFEQMDARIDRMQRFYVGTTVGSMTALTAIYTLALSFFR